MIVVLTAGASDKPTDKQFNLPLRGMTDIARLYARYRDFDLLVDSRLLTKPEHTLFLALPGERTDGHAYLPDLLQAGVRHFVVTEVFWQNTFERPNPVQDLSLYVDATFIGVEDVLATLQELAAHHRKQFHIPVVGITGSNGKTIVKDWLSALLSQRFSVCASPRSYNSQIGVPLSVWQLKKEHQIAVLEAGVSRSGDMEKLAAIVAPTHGIFTNLGEAHAAGFKDETQKLKEKMLLFSGSEALLLPADELRLIAAATQAGITVKSWRENPEDITHFQGVDGQFIPLDQLPELPAVFRYDAMIALAAGQWLGLTTEELVEGSRHFRPLELRLQVRAGRDGSTIINDTYSNDFTSLAAALQFAATQAPAEKLTLILSDLAQTADGSKQETYRRVAVLLAGKLHRLLGVGNDIHLLKAQLTSLDPKVELCFYPDTTSLRKAITELSFRDETILIKGARAFGLERLTDALTSRRHRTRLEIDLNAIRHNLSVYRAALPTEVGLAVMVKASAYGSGSIPVARLLAEAGVAYLVVAYTDEGVALREAGIGRPIMVLNPEAGELELHLKFSLEPVVTNLNLLRTIARRYPGLAVHLEFDTGMRRLGFAPEDLPELMNVLLNAGIQPRSVFTHLAASEASEHDDYTRQQLTAFGELSAKMEKAGLRPPLRHVLNTNGISRFPEHAYELVRLGIGLYGLGDRLLQAKLQPALSLKAAISGIRELPAGKTIGYNRKGKTTRPSRIGVVSIGYADGIPRLLGEGNYAFLVNGQPAPLIGTVCMDMCTIDLTDAGAVSVGDEVVVFGPDHPIEAMAMAAKTIPYELLTGIGPRVHRLYLSE